MELDAFLRRWEGDAIGLCEFCGAAIASQPHLIDFFTIGFGLSLFARNNICDRIDFLCANDFMPLVDAASFVNPASRNCSIEWQCKKNGFLIKDKKGDYGHITALLICNDDCSYTVRTGALRRIIGKTKKMDGSQETVTVLNHVDNSDDYWNFKRHNKHCVERVGQSDGFKNIIETRRLTLLISWLSNCLGYDGK